MTNLDKKKQRMAKAMDIKGPKKSTSTHFGSVAKSLSDLKRHASMFSTGKHVEVTHQGKHKLAF